MKIMKFKMFSVIVGTECCIASCPFCVSGVKPNQENLKERERQMLAYMKEEIRKKGYPPTVREICTALNIKSTSTAHKDIENLVKRGYIKKDPSKPRALKIYFNLYDAKGILYPSRLMTDPGLFVTFFSSFFNSIIQVNPRVKIFIIICQYKNKLFRSCKVGMSPQPSSIFYIITKTTKTQYIGPEEK